MKSAKTDFSPMPDSARQSGRNWKITNTAVGQEVTWPRRVTCQQPKPWPKVSLSPIWCRKQPNIMVVHGQNRSRWQLGNTRLGRLVTCTSSPARYLSQASSKAQALAPVRCMCQRTSSSWCTTRTKTRLGHTGSSMTMRPVAQNRSATPSWSSAPGLSFCQG